MPAARFPYPVVDVFAGPGGLGEGFAAVRGKSYSARFDSIVAIERDEGSYQTLLLRHFLRRFPYEQLPDDYYRYMRGEIDRDELYRNHKEEFREAKKSALKISLGPESHAQVKRIIDRRLGDEKRWVLVGGPPCQAYSLVGRARMTNDPEFEEDERHTLYLEYLKIIIDHKPPVFVMENVKGLLSAQIKGKPAITRIVNDLTNPKSAVGGGSNGLAYRLYSLSEEESVDGGVDPRLFLVRAEDYGVPQARHRMFIVGIREDVDVRPRLLRLQKPPTVRQTIGGLPPIRSSISPKRDDSVENWRKEIVDITRFDIRGQLNGAPYAGEIASGIELSTLLGLNSPRACSSDRYLRGTTGRHPTLQWLHDPNLNVLTGHEARGHMPSDLRRYMFAAVFAEVTGRTPKLKDFPEALLPDHQNVLLGRTGHMFNDRFRVQLPDQVATTITSHISKDGHYFIHYDPAQCRSLTVREAARLQTFPDNYKFEGNRTSQYHQVGNAVPPYLAMQIAEIVAEVLDSMKGER
ncbi:MAG TPA: DNA cytosine methyltransferase [Caulobacteraceae bacterium]